MQKDEIIMGSRISFFSWFKLLLLPVLVINIIIFLMPLLSNHDLTVIGIIALYLATLIFSILISVADSLLLAMALYYIARFWHFNLIFKGDDF